MMKLYVIIQEFDFFTDVHIILKNNKKNENIKKYLIKKIFLFSSIAPTTTRN